MANEESNVSGPITCIQAAAFLQHGLATDGQAMLLLFNDAEGKPFSLVLPTRMLAALRHAMSQMAKQADQLKAGAGQMVLRQPRSYTVGHSDDHRGMVAISLNPGLVDEEIFIFPDADALNLAQAMRNDVMGRMSAADRAKMITAPRKLFMPDGSVKQ